MPSAHTGEDGDQERQDESEKFKEKNNKFFILKI